MEEDQISILVEEYREIPISIAKHMFWADIAQEAGYELEDLISEGYIALVKSAETFDSKRGASFQTIANLVVQRAIATYIRTVCQQSLRYLPQEDMREFRKIKHEPIERVEDELAMKSMEDEFVGAEPVVEIIGAIKNVFSKKAERKIVEEFFFKKENPESLLSFATVATASVEDYSSRKAGVMAAETKRISKELNLDIDDVHKTLCQIIREVEQRAKAEEL